MLAGGFGNYLSVRSALRIGLIPPGLPESRIRYVGNAAALGAQLALVSEAERARAEVIARRIEHVSLAAHPDFEDIFVDCMNFPRLPPGGMTSARIPASVVGITAGPREHEIDARWLMAYAAALGEEAPEYFDTARAGGVLAHPLFPVCYEWPLALDVRAMALPDEIAVRGVHATHRLTVHRPIRAGERLRTTATVAARRGPISRRLHGAAPRDGGRRRPPGHHHRLRLPLPRRPLRPAPLSPPGRGQGEGWPR